MLNLTLQMGVYPVPDSSKWQFIMLVEGFESEEQRQVWLDKHRETLVDETLLRISK